MENFESRQLSGLTLYLTNLVLVYKANLTPEHVKMVFERVVAIIESSILLRSTTNLALALDLVGTLSYSTPLTYDSYTWT